MKYSELKLFLDSTYREKDIKIPNIRVLYRSCYVHDFIMISDWVVGLMHSFGNNYVYIRLFKVDFPEYCFEWKKTETEFQDIIGVEYEEDIDMIRELLWRFRPLSVGERYDLR